MSLRDKLRASTGRLAMPYPPDPSILLCPRVPKPLHGTAPRTVLGDKWWNTERRAAYKSTNFHCAACGVSKYAAAYHQWLEGHERYEIDYAKGRVKYVECIPLCHFCHNFIHCGRLAALLERGEIHHAKFAAIIQHGDRVLAQTGLQRQEAYQWGTIAAWAKWRLVIGRKLYPGKFKSLAEWATHFGYDINDIDPNDWFNYR